MKILQTLKKYFLGYNKKDKINNPGFCLYMSDDNEDLQIFFDLEDKIDDVDSITKLSEKYAELLVLLNNGLLKYQILESLSKNNKENNINQKVFTDSVIAFYRILEDRVLTKLTERGRKKLPLVRPTAVFNFSINTEE